MQLIHSLAASPGSRQGHNDSRQGRLGARERILQAPESGGERRWCRKAEVDVKIADSVLCLSPRDVNGQVSLRPGSAAHHLSVNNIHLGQFGQKWTSPDRRLLRRFADTGDKGTWIYPPYYLPSINRLAISRYPSRITFLLVEGFRLPNSLPTEDPSGTD
jgi:hypothetical protein